VERVNEYAEIEQEPPHVLRDSQPPPSVSGTVEKKIFSLTLRQWPAHGSISIRNLEMRYSPSQPLVLKKVSFDIPAGSKVGIVGRTGAGKSSIVGSLFRMVEPSGGSITIDGIDISTIGLHDLRSRLTIIPQDPILFAGTIRSNLDPFGDFDDEMLWSCLKRVHTSNITLDTHVAEGGLNYSNGERQLLCLARALLKNSRVTVFDEGIFQS
jgi:ABC-type multidrug transport system fused ATPase/permease subunit